MAWSFNPFTGNLDLVGSGGGAVVFEGEEATFADLPVTIGNPPVGSAYLVRESTGVWLVNRRQAGIYIRRNNTGVGATDWEYGGDYPVNSVNGQSGNIVLGAADVGAAASSHTHAAADVTSGVFNNARINWAAPAAIGNTTPAAGTFTTLTGSTQIVGPQGTNVGSSTANAITLGAANTGFHVSNTQLAAVKQGAGVWYADNSGRFVVSAGMTNGMAIEQTGAPLGFSRNISLFPDANGELHQRSGTQSQSHFFYNTFTSATNHERGFLKWNTNVFQIGTEKGSGGGTARDLVLSHDGTTRLTINDKLRTGSTAIVIGSGANIEWGGGTIGIQASTSATPAYFKIFTASTDRLIIDPNGLLCLGGTTASFPALKRSSTVLQARLADDSGFAPLQGQLRTHANAVTETITADKTLTLYDAAGTAYKVPCVAA